MAVLMWGCSGDGNNDATSGSGGASGGSSGASGGSGGTSGGSGGTSGGSGGATGGVGGAAGGAGGATGGAGGSGGCAGAGGTSGPVLDVGAGQTYATIQACLNAAAPGDTCLVHAGSYAGASFSKSGTSGKRITVRADTSGARPTVTGNFDMGNESYVTVDGFVMDGASFVGSGCSFVEIRNNTIQRGEIGRLRTCDDVLIERNTFTGQGDDPINQWGKRWVIRGNVANNLVADNPCPGKSGPCHLDFWQSHCGRPDHADFTLMENNLYADNSGSDTHFFLFHRTTNCPASDLGTNYILRYNKIRNIGSNGITFDVDSGASGFEGVAVYNNVFGDLSGGSFADWQDYVGAIDTAPGTKFFLNNILYDAVSYSSADAIYPASVPAGGSLVFDTSHTITTGGALQTCTNAGTCLINQDPRFANYAQNDFSLQASSPAIDKGVRLTRVASSDSGSGTTLTVDDPWFFQPGWAGVKGDCIAVGSPNNVACITSIDYGTGKLRLSSAVSRSGGDPVYLYSDSTGRKVLCGALPDIGAVETSCPAGCGP